MPRATKRPRGELLWSEKAAKEFNLQMLSDEANSNMAYATMALQIRRGTPCTHTKA